MLAAPHAPQVPSAAAVDVANVKGVAFFSVEAFPFFATFARSHLSAKSWRDFTTGGVQKRKGEASCTMDGAISWSRVRGSDGMPNSHIAVSLRSTLARRSRS